MTAPSPAQGQSPPVKRSPVVVAAIATALAGCTVLAGCTAPASTGEVTATPAADPGPLTATPADGAGPVPSLAVFEMAVSEGGVPAMLYDDQDADSPPSTARLGVGPDPGAWTPVSPADVESGLSIGRLVVGEDGAVTALAVLDTPDASGLHVLRVTPDGTQTATLVPDVRVGFFAGVNGVSDDGTTAVLATVDRGAEGTGAADEITVVTVDLASATVTGRAVADLGDGPSPTLAPDQLPELLDVGIGPDGAVSVLLGRDPRAAETDGAEVARFDSGLQHTGTVVVDAAAGFAATTMDLAPDGTAVIAFRPDLGGDLATRVVALAAGSTEVVPLADLAGVAVDELVAAPDGWVHLAGTDYGTNEPVLLPLDLASGATADPVPLCEGGTVFRLARSGVGGTVLAWVACPDDTRLFVLSDD